LVLDLIYAYGVPGKEKLAMPAAPGISFLALRVASS
jgi:hypothetical protein